ncbi:glycosyltransferase family 2 protein [Nocardioides yefusunii]|uniref:Glycosyltransferase family 2 protein n=1 Tax=Nocardioides yefusunii TaxID=2500546 RepID=A0ABW1R0I7_9ACTN|nr:glycosyltransferase family 2 protein [Nocardioides yefusunii]
MVFAVVTQSRGDARRLAEWVTYHSRIGFEEFHIVLDGLVDDSDKVLADLDVDARIHVHHRAESGEYQAGMDQAERWRANRQWREDNAELLASLPFRCQDPLSLRQGLNISPLMEEITADRRGWIALIDVDEFIALPRDGSIRALVRRINAEKRTSRISFLNFNVDTEGYDPSRPILEQHSMRWSREDVLAHPDPAWGRRYKTMARFKVATPYRSVHKINRGPRVVVDPEDARLLHYRTPAQRMVPHVPYTVEDPLSMPPAPVPAPPRSRRTLRSALSGLRRRVRRTFSRG